ncbi:MAG: hypothetical protein ROO76_19400 [Terriglobia bacterium]|nr:hypothetical protein [Terriglobia bacterium]
MSLRLCSHIKTNGIKCGSPALRHHTMCYFHYQWQKRDQRRVRLGGPVGMNKNSGIELPLLDGPEAILVSIMEIQRGLLDQRIEIKMGTALLYSLQLALQARIPSSGLSAREPVRECPELDMDLEMERARAMRPAKEKCAACPKQDECLSPRNCRKLPKVRGYHRVGDHLVRDADPADASTSPCHPERSSFASSTQPRHPERSCFASEMRNCGAEGPAFSPTEATALDTTPTPETGTHSFRSSDPPIVRSSDPSKTAANSYANCILGSNPQAHIDLPPKFPQLIETTQVENEGVGVANC